VAVTWDQSYETGNAAIDLQHRQLLAIVDELESTEHDTLGTQDAVLRVLDHIMEFALTHFMLEEELMARVDYPLPEREEMIAQHQEFVAYGRLRVLEFRKGEIECVLPLQSFLAEWLTVHEFGLDKKLAEFIRDREASGMEVVS